MIYGERSKSWKLCVRTHYLIEICLAIRDFPCHFPHSLYVIVLCVRLLAHFIVTNPIIFICADIHTYTDIRFPCYVSLSMKVYHGWNIPSVIYSFSVWKRFTTHPHSPLAAMQLSVCTYIQFFWISNLERLCFQVMRTLLGVFQLWKTTLALCSSFCVISIRLIACISAEGQHVSC